MQKKYLIAAIMLFHFSFLTSHFSFAQGPPIPARIGGTLTVNNTQIKKGADAGYELTVTRADGTAFTPAAEDRDGLSDSDWYQIDIPSYNQSSQPGGAEPGDTAVIHVYKESSEISVTSPANGILTVGGSGSVTQIDVVAASVTNQPPVANAGADQSVKTGETVTLNGSGSGDPDDGIVSYQWRQVSGAGVTLSDTASPQPKFTAPAAAGQLIFELTVTDRGGLTATDQVTITVTAISENKPPVANAGPNQTVKTSATVTLDGSASSDPDDGIVSYQWRQVSGAGVTLSDAAIPRPKFTAPAAAGQLIFELTVTDRGGLTATDQVTITVSSENKAPTANAGPDQTVKEGQIVTLNASGSSDPDDGIVSFFWRQTGGLGVTLSDAANSQPRFTAPDAGPGGEVLIFKLTVTDKGGLTATDQVTITVSSENMPPVANAGNNQNVKASTIVTLDASRSADTDDGIVSYRWRQISGTWVTLSDVTDIAPTFIAPTVGSGGESLVFELTVADKGGLTDTAQVTINVIVENQPPVADAGADRTVKEGESVTLDGSGSSDSDDGIASYQWRQISGIGVTLSDAASPQSKFNAPVAGSGGESLIFRLTVKDQSGLTDTDDVTVNITHTNQQPVANAGMDQTVKSGASVTLDASQSSDPDGQIVSYSWRQTAGAWVTLSDAYAKQPKFTAPNVGSAGESLTFELTVKDNLGLTDTDTVTVNVTIQNQPPVANAGTDQTVKSGASVTLDGTQSSDPDGQIMSYSWRQTAGTSVNLSDNTVKQPKFTAPNMGTAGESLTFELTVTDNLDLAATDSVTVNVVSQNQAPVANAGPDQSINAGATVTLDASKSSDPDDGIAAYLWRQTDGTVITLSNAAALKPTFTAPATGGISLTFELTVTDKAGLQNSDTVTVHILSQNQAPFASAGPDQFVKQGELVTLDGSNSADPDGQIVSYRWRQTDGTVVRLSDATIAQPTFTAPSTILDESLTFELTVTDNLGLTDIVTVRVNVVFSNLPPVAEAGPDQTVTQGTVVTLDGSNSSDPDGQIVSYTWKQISGASVSLSGAQGRQPVFTASDGGFVGQALTFELTVTDDDGLTAADRVTVNVTAQNRPPAADAGPDQTVNEGDRVILDGSNSSDPDGRIVSYLWRQTGGRIMAISHITAVQAEFTASNGDLQGESLVFELVVTDNSGLQHTDRVTVNIFTAGNSPPAASAGPDLNVREGCVVTLNGSNSSDPDDGIAGYQWRQIRGDSVTFSDAAAVQPKFTAPEVSASGKSLTFELTVTDNGGLQSTDTVTVNITNINQPPSADAGPVQTVNEGDRVILDGANSSDPDGDIASYLWAQTSGSPVTLSDPTDSSPEFTAPNFDLNSGALTFRLTVSDNGGLRDTDRVAINITFTNQTPAADAGGDQTVAEGTTVLFDASKSFDPDGSIASYHWRQIGGAAVTLSSTSEPQVNFVPPPTDAQGMTLIFELTVTDNGGLKDTDEVSVRVYDNGITAYADDVISFRSAANQEMGIKSSVGNITALYIRDTATIAETADKPEDILYGLIQAEIKTDKSGDTAAVFVYLPASAPQTHKWYRYSRAGAWYDYSANSSFSTDRKRITLSFDDGGLGDNDGLANRQIKSVSGLARAKQKDDTEPVPEPKSESGGGETNCFISTVAE